MMRKLSDTFSAVYLQTDVAINKPHEDEALITKVKEKVYPKIFSINWGQKKDGFESAIVASIPFTYVDWKTMELTRDGQFEISELTWLQIQKLCLNIVPGLQTFPQFLARNGDALDNFIPRVIEKIGTDEEPVVPFARNIWGNTSLHILQELGDVKHANELLKILGKSPTHHHSMDISDVIGWLIEENIPEIQTYFDSRMIETQPTRKIKKGTLKVEGE